MRAKSFALLILALGCGLVASIGITQVLSKKDVEPVPLSADEVSVFVVMEDIERYEPLTAQMLKLEPWPKDRIPAGALTKIEDIEGRKTRTQLFAGEPILDNKLFPKGKDAAGVSGRIPAGYRAIPISVDSVSGGGGMIQPGDRVDVTVYVKKNPAEGIYQSGIQDVLQDIKVFAVNSTVDIQTDETGSKQLAAKTISLLVTPNQAKKLMLASELGSVRLMMRGIGGEEAYEEGMYGSGELFGESDESDPLAERPGVSTPKGGGLLDMLNGSTRSSAGARPRQGIMKQHKIRIVRGGDVENVTLGMVEDQLGTGGGRWRVIDSSSYIAPSTESAEPLTPEVPVEPDPEQEDASPEERPGVEGN